MVPVRLLKPTPAHTGTCEGGAAESDPFSLLRLQTTDRKMWEPLLSAWSRSNFGDCVRLFWWGGSSLSYSTDDWYRMLECRRWGSHQPSIQLNTPFFLACWRVEKLVWAVSSHSRVVKDDSALELS